ncbi:EamA-like transporter family protein [Psychrobacter pasteurii]|uniref:EamA-like transporter family protein n=1 Tax=Psychrobacter pasteurii TaxID=1945520 RepID=A0A1R4EGQ1_9GAMM|nr:DMT family transporter [Psychrobacter pasteurii]SJM37668.1 EamA-like transporter family protein [Psychrobacter pasteurii]
MNKQVVIALTCLIAGGALLGVSTNMAKYAGTVGLTPLAFVFWSITGAALLLLALAVFRRQLPPITKPSIEYYLVAALVSVAGSNLIFFSAIPQVGASFVALVITLPPLLTYVGALLLKMERFDPIRALGVLAALAGAAVLAANKLNTPNASAFWILVALCGPVLLAIGNLYRTLRWPAGASPSALAPGMLVAASLQLGVFSLLPNFSLALPSQDPLALTVSIALIGLQAFIFAAQFQLLFVLQKAGGPVLLSLLGSTAAVFAVPIAIFLQGEPPPEGLALGALLIALGVAFVTWGGLKKPQ